MLRHFVALLFASVLFASPAFAQKRALFDNTKAQTAGNADWVIDVNQPVPSPAQSGITWATPENYWTGANSAWGVQLVKRGYTVATLTSAFGITYQNLSNPYDLSNYDVFITNEPNIRFSSAESTAIFNFVRDGGGLFAISDHNASDRNNDGFDSPHVLNLLDSQQLFGAHFNVTGDPNNSITQTSTNVNPSPADSVITGAAGLAPGIAFHAGTVMQLNTAANPTVTGDIWINGQAQGSTVNVMVAHSTYGNGRVVYVTDSSPADDGTGNGGSLFNGWAESSDSLVFLNGTIWATRRGAFAPDLQPPVVTVTSPVGAESWAIGAAHNVTWTATDNIAVTSVDIAFSTDGGATFPNAIATGVANTGTFAWTISSLPSSTARVRVIAHDAAGNVGSDSSHANFSITGWTVTSSALANGSIAPNGVVGVGDGATPAYVISPAFGYHVADVLVNGSSAGAVTNYTFAPVHADQTIVASFALNTSDTQAPVVTVTSPVGGESWPIGSSQNITWTATDDVGVTTVDLAYSNDGGATFAGAIANGIANSGSYAWSIAGLPSTSVRVRVTAHDAAGNIGSDSSHANFTRAGWTVTSSAGANGSISPNGPVGFGDGTTPAYIITPNAGFHVADVLVNGGSVGAVTSYSFAPVHSDQTIAASFAPSDFTVNVTLVGSGTVAKSPDQPTYPGGSTMTLTATPSGGWSFAGWSGDATGSINPLSVLVTGDRNITATFTQHVYTWNQAGTAAWGTSTNWTPTRTTPATDDVLIFNGGGSVTSTGVPAQTIGQLQISGNTSVALQPGAAATLTLAGTSGLGLDLAAGSSLLLNGSSALSLALSGSATGSVRGAITATGAAHRLFASGAGSLAFQGGATLTLGTGFSGNIFGTGAAPGALNSVVFQSGSMLAQGAGANPFGATSPNAVVSFQPGSRFRLDAALTPSMSGRLYADFELNSASTILPSGSNAYTMDSLIVSQGTLNLSSLSAGGNVRGNIKVKPGATLSLIPAGAVTLTLGGSSPQALRIQGTLNTSATSVLSVNNASGVSLVSNVTLNGTVSFVRGTITTGGNSLVTSSTGVVAGASQSTGWVAGTLRRLVAAGSPTVKFDVGDALRYAPVTVAISGAVSSYELTASCATGDHPNLAGSDLDPAKSVNRYWTLTPTGSPSFTSFDPTFSYPATDVDGGANPAVFLVRRYSAGWNSATIGTRTATTTQATGVTGFGDFAIGEFKVPTFTITATAGANGTISPNGAVVVASGAGQGFTITPALTYVVQDVLVDLVSVGPVATYNFPNVTADHTISATFTQLIEGVGGGPRVLSLSPAQPNPSSRITRLGFSLPREGSVRLEVVDVHGRVVMRTDSPMGAGSHAFNWDGRTSAGARVGAGLYFVRLQTPWGTRTGRFVRVQ